MKKLKIATLFFLTLLIVPLIAACSSTAQPYNSKEKIGPQINYTVTGIDAGAGIMASTQNALKDYGLEKKNWQLQTSSTAAMTSTLDKAIKDKRPIVITGWQPHWMFTKFPIKFLKDPKNVYGKEESIHTIVRQGLKSDMPEAYTILDRFHWNPTQMSAVMLKVNNGMDPQKAAKQWIKANPDRVNEWTKGVKKVHGKSIKMTYVAWDSEIASTNVVAQVLRDQGYKVTIQAMEQQPMWASVATKAADAQVSAWLPKTSGLFYKDYKGKFVDLGANLHGAKVGLAVPKYMTNINSIDDLKNK
ncbi:glycine betaine ABC transporter substrate-binding protein [Companilactobacillus ginsenosidimutans]|uniref:Glycine/betaine ABC transporter n=1 Tax=Companilactobacillus ginsenosidimutans TaxID=1007676 RepID=A0A0H4QJD6_9LACO|nr:glycine betaine ABC transporter substrate-binding protein [Companilactobacillus ginsenosidimutans]AKP67156.1 glycine/betaine ABC transporter [Companilactobacillus ginsenosidimutans]